MKHIYIAILLISFQVANGQDCKTKASNKPAESFRFQDDYERSGEGPKVDISIAKMKTPLSIAENWVKGLLKNFTGAKLAYSNDYFFNYKSGFTESFYKASGIKGCYSAKMRFYAYYCYENRNDIFTEDESGSFAAVYFNNVFIPSLCTSVGVYTINGKSAFTMFEKNRTVGRIDYYEQIAMSNVFDTVYKSKNEFIIIRNSDQPVFLPITRKEYLQQLLKDVEVYKSRELAAAKMEYTPANEAANKSRYDEELKRIDNSKNYTAAQMAPYRKRFIETWETEKQKFDKRVARIETETSGAKGIILEYQKKPEEWLNRTFPHFYGYSSYSGKGMKEYLDGLDIFSTGKEVETRTYVATINPNYYNKSLSAEVPQLVMVHLPKGTYPHMQKVSKLVNMPGALQPLENILAHGKHPVEQPVLVPASPYRVTYLTKLTQLKPLVLPADMKPSIIVSNPVANPPVSKFTFEIPSLSPKLKELPSQVVTLEAYKNYVVKLHSKISRAVRQEIKKKADEYIDSKKITRSGDISNSAFAAWLQNSQEASLYLYSKAVVNNPNDALTANNFSAFLIMGGLPEKSIPILEFWNKQKPGEPSLLANLGNAYFKLGDTNNALKYLQQCVQKDSLHPTANKILCIMYLKKGDTKKAEEHATTSLTASYDHDLISIMRQVNRKAKTGEIMARLPIKEFPLVKRTKLPEMPSKLDEMEDFLIELNAEKESLNETIAAIESKIPRQEDDLQQKILKSGLSNGTLPIAIKAQQIIMDGLLTFQEESSTTADLFHYKIKKLAAIHNPKIRAIIKEYNIQIGKYEGGEAGDEDKIQALELAKCNAVNAATEKYLTELAPVVNAFAQRQEYISRKFYCDYANYAPFWLGGNVISFQSIERDYLQDISNILGEYMILSKSNCSDHEPATGKKGQLKQWEDEYCSNFKGKVEMGTVKLFFTCNSWGVDGGEGIVGDFEFKYRNDGAFENFTVGAGLGANWDLGHEGFVNMEIGISGKGFVKIGPDATTGKWIIQDVGVKTEVAGEAGIGKFSVEEKVLEVSLAVNAGMERGGIVPAIFDLK